MNKLIGVYINLAFVIGAFFGTMMKSWIFFLIYANLMTIWTIIDIKFANVSDSEVRNSKQRRGEE